MLVQPICAMRPRLAGAPQGEKAALGAARQARRTALPGLTKGRLVGIEPMAVFGNTTGGPSGQISNFITVIGSATSIRARLRTVYEGDPVAGRNRR